MTNEEQDIKWAYLPPYKCTTIHLIDCNRHKTTFMEVTQDTIDDIIAYFEAARESMNVKENEK